MSGRVNLNVWLVLVAWGLLASPTTRGAPPAINFYGSGSSDPDETVVSYHWDFVSGADSDESNPAYAYEQLGTYTATLTVTDDHDATGTSTATVVINGEARHITLTSLADSWIQDEGGNSRDENMGEGGLMAIGGRWHNTYFRGLIRFDLSSIPCNAIVSNASLRLYHTMNAVEGSNVNNISLYGVLRDWNEHEVTWNHYAAEAPWIIPGAGSIGHDREDTQLAEGSFTSATPVYEYYDFDVTSTIQDYVDGIKPNYGFILVGKEAPAANRYFTGFSTKESASDPPLLDITYALPPGARPPIQVAIDDAGDGDIIVVEPGHYCEHIDFKGKNLTLRSTDPNDPAVVAATVMKGRGHGLGVTFSSGEDADCVLAGFTITDASVGIYCSGASPTITNCCVTGNSDAGIELRDGSKPTITKCRIAANAGSGIEMWPKQSGRFTIYNYPTITNSVIAGNLQHGILGGIPTITNCTIVANQRPGVSGLMPVIANSIIYYNDTAYDVVQIESDFATVIYSDVQGGWPGAGNINADPCFVEPGYSDPNGVWVGGDYHLLPGSPCINAGTNWPAAGLPETDIDGEPRVMSSRVDIGADEYVLPIHNANQNAYYETIQEAIDDAHDGDEIIISPRTYTGPGNRDIDFRRKAITVRSVDPNDPDVVVTTIIDCNGSEIEPHRGFYFHWGEDADSVLAGITIRNAYADFGGGIRCVQSSPTIRNCVLRKNCANWGGGLENENSSPTLTGCVFSENSATMSGGAIRNLNSSSNVSKCLFIDNEAQYGGAIHNEDTASRATLIRCTFIGNAATQFGGAIRNHTSSPTILDCLIIGNQARSGGGIQNENDRSNPTLINCTISGNSAAGGGGGITNNGSKPILNSCLLWANTDNGGSDMSAQIHGGQPTVHYSCIQGWSCGRFCTNIDVDPCFVDVAGGDYHLLPGSPCINAGDPEYTAADGQTDIDGGDRVMLGRVDMGADEFDPYEVTLDVYDTRRIGRTEFEYDCKLILTNVSRFAIENVELCLVKVPQNMTIIQPNVTFGDMAIAPGESATSIDTCTFRVDRSAAIELAEIVFWEISCEIIATGETMEFTGSGVGLLGAEYKR